MYSFMCSCDCMSCVHGQHCGQCRSDNRLHNHHARALTTAAP